jgi:hypothetical protein
MADKTFTERRVLMWVRPEERGNSIPAGDDEVRELLMPLQIKELADISDALEAAKVPRTDSNGEPMTLAERVVWSTHSECVFAGHRVLDAAGVPTQLNGKDMSIADRIAWLASKR